MRAIAVLAVVYAHAKLPGLPGGFVGVDVFFVISGFLITRLLAAELVETGHIDLFRFWAKRVRRLLPNAYAALIGTALLALLLFPGYSPSRLAEDITAAALQFANFHFADEAVDYFQSDLPASPVLHFWSLSVEEQFYLVWPPLLLAVAWRFRRHPLRAAVILLSVIWCASFAASLWVTWTEQPFAYFSMGTRAWQLATGALLALGWRQIEALPQALRRALAWLGVAGILVSMALITGDADYPGLIALAPTLTTAALIAGFEAAAPGGVLRRGLSLPVMQWLGARSYSWYLWHWPLMALPRLADPDSPYIEAIALPVSLVIAALAYRWIETPPRQVRGVIARPTPTLAIAAAGLLIVIGIGHDQKPALFLVNKQLAARYELIRVGSEDYGQVEDDKCLLRGTETVQPDCAYGDLGAPRRVVLFGDSHAAHWSSALMEAVRRTGWRLHHWAKASCPAADVNRLYNKRPHWSCPVWREAVMAKLTGLDRPELVIVSNAISTTDLVIDPKTGKLLTKHESRAAWAEGFRRTLRRLIEAGVKVIVIRDIPFAQENYRDCLMTPGRHCDTPREAAFPYPALDAEVAREFPGEVTLVDFTDLFCDDTACAVMRDGLIVYRNATHLTASFAATFTPQMAHVLEAMAARLPQSAENRMGNSPVATPR